MTIFIFAKTHSGEVLEARFAEDRATAGRIRKALARAYPAAVIQTDYHQEATPMPQNPPPDMVNHPPHYQGSIECVDAIESALGRDGFIAYCRGNAIKYLWRAGKKIDAAEDMAKAEWYAKRAADAMEKTK